MRVLVLGASGTLGKAVVRAFESEEVTGWDRTELDITDERAVAERIPMLEPRVVINAAAYTDVDKAEEEPDEADAVNGHAVGNLAVTCADAEIPLLHVSTDYVFAGGRSEGYSESDEPEQPVNAYGRSKLLGETLLRENGRTYWLVRTAWLFGARGQGFVDAIIRQSAAARELRVVADQHGNPTYAWDLAQAIRNLVTDRAPSGTYHLVNAGEASRADFAEVILRSLGRDVRVVPVPSAEFPTKARRPQRTILRNTKRPPLRPWREALQDFLRTAYRSESAPV